MTVKSLRRLRLIRFAQHTLLFDNQIGMLECWPNSRTVQQNRELQYLGLQNFRYFRCHYSAGIVIEYIIRILQFCLHYRECENTLRCVRWVSPRRDNNKFSLSGTYPFLPNTFAPWELLSSSGFLFSFSQQVRHYSNNWCQKLLLIWWRCYMLIFSQAYVPREA